MTDQDFWKHKKLGDLDSAEWEALCDGCGRCCLHKLIDVASGIIAFTNIACRLLDPKTCRCQHYAERLRLVHDCIDLTSQNIGDLSWLPPTCAYRLIDEGKPLDWWHPLVSGDPQTVHQAGISVRGQTVNEDVAGDPEDHIVDWSGD